MPPFGTYEPSGRNRFILLLIKAGLGRGKLKKLFSRLWKSSADCNLVDVRYHGLRLRLAKGGNSIESKILFSSRLREKEELAFIRSALADGGTFVDIGSNVGYYSLMAAQFGARKVIAFEPNPELVARFRANAAFSGLAGSVTLVPKALGDAEGNTNLHLTAHDLGSSSLLQPQRSYQVVSVPQTTLKTVLRDHAIERIDALKIDVEGYEDKVMMPFFDSVDESLHPAIVIIEDTSRAVWERSVVDWMVDHQYALVARTRGNAILQKRVN